MLTFLSNSSADFVATETVGGFNSGSQKNTFDDIFTETYNDLMANSIDLMVDINSLMKNKAKLAAFKDSLLGELKQECADMADDPDHEYGTHTLLYEQVSDMFDNCVDDFYKESTRVSSLLPIKAVDFPVLVKQQLKLATKDIMQTEVTKTPVVKKHIEQTYVVDPKTQKRWRYPQCFFTDEFKEIYAAGKGIPIKNTKVELPKYNMNVVSELTDGDATKDEFTMDLRIENVYVTVKSEEFKIPMDPPMRINLSDNTWLGGKVDTTVTLSDGSTEEVKDVVMGIVDFVEKTTTVNSAAGLVTAVEFSGYLSNELNERAVTFDYAREEREWKIEDGMRADVPYSLEELEDTKALMDIDLYKKTYNNLSDILTQMEDSTVLDWLDQQFEKYDGVEVDPLQWNSFIRKDVFDCDSTGITTALPDEYIERMFKFKIDRIINDIADTAKMDDFTFVVYGNPRFISLLNSKVNWVTRPGSTSNGVKLDYGYGIMTSGDVKVQVVSTKKVNATYDKDEKTYSGVRIIPFPLSQEQFTFKHYKYTTHILTAQNSAYRSPQRQAGGSYTYLIGTSRYTNAAIQGIQAQLKISSAEQYINLTGKLPETA
jgi:hypothetical protein